MPGSSLPLKEASSLWTSGLHSRLIQALEKVSLYIGSSSHELVKIFVSFWDSNIRPLDMQTDAAASEQGCGITSISSSLGYMIVIL